MTDTDATVPLEPDRGYDKPAGPHTGRGCALRVPVSSGPSHYELDRGERSYDALCAEEPDTDPLAVLALGSDTPELASWYRRLDRPIAPQDFR